MYLRCVFYVFYMHFRCVAKCALHLLSVLLHALLRRSCCIYCCTWCCRQRQRQQLLLCHRSEDCSACSSECSSCWGFVGVVCVAHPQSTRRRPSRCPRPSAQNARRRRPRGRSPEQRQTTNTQQTLNIHPNCCSSTSNTS